MKLDTFCTCLNSDDLYVQLMMITEHKILGLKYLKISLKLNRIPYCPGNNGV